MSEAGAPPKGPLPAPDRPGFCQVEQVGRESRRKDVTLAQDPGGGGGWFLEGGGSCPDQLV